MAARVQGRGDDTGNPDARRAKRAFKAELRDTLTVVSSTYHDLGGLLNRLGSFAWLCPHFMQKVLQCQGADGCEHACMDS